MKRSYIYSWNRYVLSLLGPVICMIAFLGWSIVQLLSTSAAIHIAAIGIVLLLLFAEIVNLNHPSQITDDGEVLAFSSFGRRHAFPWSQITAIKIRRFPMTSQVLVRISRGRKERGYWINFQYLCGGDELLDKMSQYQVVSAAQSIADKS